MLQFCTSCSLFEPEGEFSDDLSFGCAVISEDMLSTDLEEFVPECLCEGRE